jgi:hypothetical protein
VASASTDIVVEIIACRRIKFSNPRTYLPPGVTGNPQKISFADTPWSNRPGFRPGGGHFASISWH